MFTSWQMTLSSILQHMYDLVPVHAVIALHLSVGDISWSC